MSATGAVLLKMFNEAVPAGNTLSGPIVPFPVSLTFRTSLRNEIFHLQIGSARLYNMAGQWSSFELGYTNRDGSIGTDTNLLFVRPLRTLSNGNPIQVRDFTTRSPGIPAATGMGSVFVTLKMADGSVYSSADREERAVIDDGILIDIGDAYSCRYSGTGNQNAAGLNITAAVLGRYDSKDKVTLIYRTAAGNTGSAAMEYRRNRDAYYTYYSVFVPNIDRLGLASFGAKVVKADGSVHQDDRNGIYYTPSVLDTCLPGATIPVSGPQPSALVQAPPRRRAFFCSRGETRCDGACVDIMTNLEHCGGCSDKGLGEDCTLLSDGDVRCVRGKCTMG